MAVTYGFYNALAHDRVYDAIQMSSIFDGIIRDGVFSTIGEALICKASGNGLVVNVGAGRAWFNHTWTLNDTDYPVEAEQAEVVLDRIDAIVLEVNSAVEVRANSIKFIKGTPSSNPVRPTLTHNAEVNQYALAYVSIRAGQTTIFQEDITNVVGTDETPFVTGLLQQLSIENLVLQWENEFDRHFADFVATNESEFNTWSSEMQAQYTAWMNSKMAEYAQWYANMQAEGDANLAEFDAWFQHMKDQLDSDAAGHLQAEIDQLALEAGKGSVLTVHTINTSLYGRTVTVRQNEQIQTALFDNTGTAVFNNMPYIGEISITSTDGTQTATTTMNIPYFGRYTANIAFWAATVNINTTSSEFYGLTVTVAKDGVAAGTAIFDNAGHTTYTAMAPGSYKFTVNYDGMDFDSTISITEEVTYTVILNAWTATLDIVTSVSELYTRPVTIKKGETIVGTTNFDGSGNATYKVHQTGTYTIVSTDTLGNTYQESVAVTDETVYEVSLGLPNGETALPVNDIGIWLQCAEILNKNYTTLGEVLADDECFAELLGNSNACAYMARSTAWAADITTDSAAMDLLGMFDVACKKLLANATWVEAIANSEYRDSVLNIKAPNSNSGGTATASSNSANSANAFDDDPSTTWTAASTGVASWLQYTFPTAQKVYAAKLRSWSQIQRQPGAGAKLEYLDNGSWITAKTISTSIGYDNPTIVVFDEPITAESFRLSNLTSSWETSMSVIQFYGRENLSDTYVPLVPTMTDNTHPSGTGECIGGADLILEAYKSFDNSDTSQSCPVSGTSPYYVGFHFDSPKVVRKVYCKYYLWYTNASYKVQGSNDGTNWTDLASFSVQGTSSDHYEEKELVFDNNTAYSYYRLYTDDVAYVSGSAAATFSVIQFYSQYTKGMIHSAANDTIYYSNNGTNVPVATTDANGDGELDFSSLTPGTYTLYSTVAKDPTNLNNPYTKQIHVTKNTKEVYFMPIRYLYWYGKESRYVLHNTAVYGSGYQGVYQVSKNWNTNDLQINGYEDSTGAAWVACPLNDTVDLTSFSKIKTIVYGSSAWGMYVGTTPTPLTGINYNADTTTPTYSSRINVPSGGIVPPGASARYVGIQCVEIDTSSINSGSVYMILAINNALSDGHMNAAWLER